MLSKSRTETQIVSLDNCQFEQNKETVTLTTATTPAPKQAIPMAPNPLATSYVPKTNVVKKQPAPIKGLIVSRPDDSPFDKFMNMLANLLKKFENMFLKKLEQKLPPTIKIKTPMKKKKKTSIWEREDDLKNLSEKE